VWIIENLNLSGLAECPKCFARKETLDLWAKLQGLNLTNRMIIQGPPGIGKSTELYAWVQYKRKERNILYLHFSSCKGIFILVCTPDYIQQYVLYVATTTLLIKDFILSLSENLKVKFDIVVCDGFLQQSGMLSLVFSIFREQIVIYCSSYKASNEVKGESRQILAKEHGSLITFEMNSWQFCDYIAAFKEGVFEVVFNSTEEIHKRYHYAGGNLRLMLLSENDCLDELNSSFARVNDYKLILAGLCGQSSGNSVNTLFQRIEGQFRLVSEYAERYLLKMFPDKNSEFISFSKNNIMTNNPSFQGWIFEFEVLDLIQKKQIELSALNGHPWNNHCAVLYFHDANDLREKLPFINPNTLLVPFAYNHKLVDVMLYVQPGQLRAANITLAKKHIFRMDYILPYLQLFCDANNRCSLTFDVIIPLEKRTYYQITKRHFTYKHKLLKYDDKWTPRAETSSLASVFLMNRSQTKISSTEMLLYHYPPESENTVQDEVSDRVLRKRARIDSSLEQEEDEEELEIADDPDECDCY
jgi:hypothetical protein